MSHSRIHLAVAAALVLCAQAAVAQDKGAEDRPHASIESFHAQCIGCHGIPGYKTAYPEVYHVPKLGGQHAAYIVQALHEYRNGERSHPSMQAIAGSLSDQDMANLAAYYSQAGVHTNSASK